MKEGELGGGLCAVHRTEELYEFLREEWRLKGLYRLISLLGASCLNPERHYQLLMIVLWDPF